MDHARICRCAYNILKFSIRQNSVAAIRDDAKNDSDEGEEGCQSVWYKEAAGVVSVAIHRVPASDLGSSFVPVGAPPSVHSYVLAC